MSKKNLIIIISIIVMVLAVVGIYGTFASSSTVVNDDTTYNIVLTNSTEEVVIPAHSSKMIMYQIINTNKGKVQYGVVYYGTGITVREYIDSEDQATGLIDYGENKFVKLYISNNGSTESTASIKTVLGYENGGDLIIPSGYTLVTEKIGNTSKYIIDLYTSSEKTTVVNNNITYNYANIYDIDDDSTTSGGLMNDRLGGTTAGLDAGNIRYYGASPNNYIYFNCSDYDNQSDTTCEKWRIIGVFDGKVKIIRNESIGSYSWDTSASSINDGYGINEWSQADLMKLLNPEYESETVGGSLYWNSGSGTCYSETSNGTTSCDFTSTGLKNVATRNMIAEVTWNLGGYSSYSVYSNQMYGYERGTTTVSNPSDGVTRTTSWIGKIALAYPSDYGYAADFSSCSKQLSDYNDATCTSVNWMKTMFGSNSTWLLSPDLADASGALAVGAPGYAAGDYSFNAYGVGPVLYLNSELEIGSGAGLSSNPYRLSES